MHALLSMGHAQLDRWLPGITEELVVGGAQVGRDPQVHYYVDGVLKAWKTRLPGGNASCHVRSPRSGSSRAIALGPRRPPPPPTSTTW
ncbi:hypothetical protein [Streptomyces sp. enrichment culture]|uniref:hypothetical protein n=1 Tax=Streptomyces sp. enrichment culture TaxID=1795815 RepID=UPI003F56C6F6